MRDPAEDDDLDRHERCRVCGSEKTWTFAAVHNVPIHSNVLALSRAEALSVPQGDLDMKCCRDCGHVFNQAFRSEALQYSSDYENSLFFSERYSAYASSLVGRLVEKFGVHDKKVAEIGCGAGDFLKLLCERGANSGIGFDPSASAGRAVEGHPRIEFVRDYYSAKHAHLDADVLCCRHVLEHVDFPRRFLKGIREALTGGKQAVVFFEVPDVMFILKERSSWDLLYEHCSYFSTSSLHRLFTTCGFRVLEIWGTFQDQFLCVCAEPSPGLTVEGNEAAEDWKSEVLQKAAAFSRAFEEQVENWGRSLRQLEAAGTRVVLWGAGSKGVTFLNILKGDGFLEYIVDVNETKHGKHIPGTGQRVVSPAFLKDYKPGTVILMNPAYEEEVRRMLDAMGLHPEILIGNQADG